MQINFTGHHLHTTDALKKVTNEKLEKLHRHFDQISTVHVTFKVEHLSQIAEASLHIPGNEIHAKAEAGDMYAAIDAMINKLEIQLKKIKSKLMGLSC